MSTLESCLPGSWSGVGSSQDILLRPWCALNVASSVCDSFWRDQHPEMQKWGKHLCVRWLKGKEGKKGDVNPQCKRIKRPIFYAKCWCLSPIIGVPSMEVSSPKRSETLCLFHKRRFCLIPLVEVKTKRHFQQNAANRMQNMFFSGDLQKFSVFFFFQISTSLTLQNTYIHVYIYTHRYVLFAAWLHIVYIYICRKL